MSCCGVSSTGRLDGRRVPSHRQGSAARAVGSTLLFKGLEADVAVMLDAEELNVGNFYVTMIRSSRKLVVCDRSRRSASVPPRRVRRRTGRIGVPLAADGPSPFQPVCRIYLSGKSSRSGSTFIRDRNEISQASAVSSQALTRHAPRPAACRLRCA